MAILKHIASKNADYGEAERYLIFQHDEYTQKPILDENGHMLIREEYYLDGINCDPFTFAAECQETNAYFHKNQSYNEIKSHHYIISFDPKPILLIHGHAHARATAFRQYQRLDSYIRKFVSTFVHSDHG